MPHYRVVVHDVQSPFAENGQGEGAELGSIEATYSEGGDEIFFASGYSAREISQQRRDREGGAIYVNRVSRKIREITMEETVNLRNMSRIQ